MTVHPSQTDEASLYRWIDNLAKYPDLIRQVAQFWRMQAEYAQEELPASERLVESLNRAASLLEQAAGGSDDWHPTAMASAQQRIGRVDDPRGGHARERRADHTIAQGDHPQ